MEIKYIADSIGAVDFSFYIDSAVVAISGVVLALVVISIAGMVFVDNKVKRQKSEQGK